MAMLQSVLERGVRLASSPRWYPLIERAADAPIPRPLRAMVHRVWGGAFGVDFSEVAGRLGDYGSVSSFFVRRLRPGIRPIDPDPAVVVSPADGRIESSGRFASGEDPVVEVKGVPVALGTLLGRYRSAVSAGGWHAVVYLSPRDYHRVHSPVSGRIRSWQAVPGTRFPVNRLGWTACPEVLFRNERVVVEMEVADGERLYLVLVAAWGVARIGLAFAGGHVPMVPESWGDPAEPIPVDRGDELGWFNLGSTVVLIWPSARIPVQSLLHAGPVRIGQALARTGTGNGP